MSASIAAALCGAAFGLTLFSFATTKHIQHWGPAIITTAKVAHAVPVPKLLTPLPPYHLRPERPRQWNVVKLAAPLKQPSQDLTSMVFVASSFLILVAAALKIVRPAPAATSFIALALSEGAGVVPRLTQFPSSPSESSLPDPPGDQPFLGKRWLDTTCELITKGLDRSDRVPPMSLACHSKGGKTRALLEIAHKLFDQGVPAIFISFRGDTAYSEHEAQQVSPLESLLTRIAWACTTERPVRELCSQRGLNCCIDKDTFLKWLYGLPRFVLLIDELDNLIDGTVLQKEKEEWTPREKETYIHFSEVNFFLTNGCCDKKGHYVVSSSLRDSIWFTIEEFQISMSLRGQLTVGLPNMRTMDSTDEEQAEYVQQFGYSLSAYCSYLPGLLMTYKEAPEQLALVRQQMESLLPKSDLNPWIREFLYCLFEGGYRSLTEPWDQFTSTEVLEWGMLQEPGKKCKPWQEKSGAIWSPLMLREALGCLGASGNPAFCKVAEILSEVPKCQEDNEAAWKHLCSAVLGLRCLNYLYGDRIEMEWGLLPPLPKDFKLSIDQPVNVTTPEEILALYPPKMKESSCPIVQLVLPQGSQFQIFDAFLFVWNGSQFYRWGYQMTFRTSRDLPSDVGVDAAILLNADPPAGQETELQYLMMGEQPHGGEVQWGQLSSRTLKEFFGTSLQFVTPPQWELRRKNI